MERPLWPNKDSPGSAWGQGELESSVSVIKIHQGLARERLGPKGTLDLIKDSPGSAWGQGELENSVSVIKIVQGLAWERLGPGRTVSTFALEA